jgi:hypothetical protein
LSGPDYDGCRLRHQYKRGKALGRAGARAVGHGGQQVRVAGLLRRIVSFPGLFGVLSLKSGTGAQ